MYVCSALHGAIATSLFSVLIDPRAVRIGLAFVLLLVAVSALPWPAGTFATLLGSGASASGLSLAGYLVPIALAGSRHHAPVAIAGASVHVAITFFARRRIRALSVSNALATLVFGFEGGRRLLSLADPRIYEHEVVHVEESRFQRIVLTRRDDDLRLYLDGCLQHSSVDEAAYHRALVHPALALAPAARSVLILGGGDGLAARDVLGFASIQRVTLVEIDPRVTALARQFPGLAALNLGALRDRRIRLVHADAERFVRSSRARWDVILADFPDPANATLARLFSHELYELIAARLSPGGIFVTQATSASACPRAFACIASTVSAAFPFTATFRAPVPSFQDAAFVLASNQPLSGPVPPPEAFHATDVSTLEAPRIVALYNERSIQPRASAEGRGIVDL